MGKPHKQQHYVPQFYLRRFANSPDRNKIWALDKVAGCVREVGIRNVAGQAEFYGPANAADSLEKTLGGRELTYQRAISLLTEVGSPASLSDQTRHDLAEFTAVQYLRTPEVRFQYGDMAAAQYEAATGDTVFLSSLETEKVLRQQLSELHGSILRDEVSGTEIREGTEAFLDLTWTLVRNNTDLAFWSSDNPIGRHNNLRDDSARLLGPQARGIQIYVPLDPIYCLMMYDTKTYPERPPFLGCSDVTFVQFANVIQFMYSTRYVFSNARDFADSLHVLRRRPPVLAPNHNRLSVRFYSGSGEEVTDVNKAVFVHTRDNLRPKGKPAQFTTIEDLEDDESAIP